MVAFIRGAPNSVISHGPAHPQRSIAVLSIYSLTLLSGTHLAVVPRGTEIKDTCGYWPDVKKLII